MTSRSYCGTEAAGVGVSPGIRTFVSCQSRPLRVKTTTSSLPAADANVSVKVFKDSKERRPFSRRCCSVGPELSRKLLDITAAPISSRLSPTGVTSESTVASTTELAIPPAICDTIPFGSVVLILELALALS